MSITARIGYNFTFIVKLILNKIRESYPETQSHDVVIKVGDIPNITDESKIYIQQLLKCESRDLELISLTALDTVKIDSDGNISVSIDVSDIPFYLSYTFEQAKTHGINITNIIQADYINVLIGKIPNYNKAETLFTYESLSQSKFSIGLYL